MDPLLEPANGPDWLPFDPDILYEIKIDNKNDAVEDISFQFRFSTEQRLPNLFLVHPGVGTNAPANPPVRFPSAPSSSRPRSALFLPSDWASATPPAGAGPLYAVPARPGPCTVN